MLIATILHAVRQRIRTWTTSILSRVGGLHHHLLDTFAIFLVFAGGYELGDNQFVGTLLITLGLLILGSHVYKDY